MSPSTRKIAVFSVSGLLLLGSLSCSSPPDIPTPTQVPATPTLPAAMIIPSPTVAPAERATAIPVPSDTPLEVLTPAPEPTPAQSNGPAVTEVPLNVTILSPSENIEVEVGVVRVLGSTLPEVSVGVNGVSVDLEPDGSFQRDLPLAEGINSIDVVATAPSGQVATKNVAVLFVPRAEGVPLSVLYPHGLEVDVPSIIIVGATRQDAVVGIDGVPVDVNSLGIFSTDVSLEKGANLIQIVAVDLEDNISFQTVAVFYLD